MSTIEGVPVKLLFFRFVEERKMTPPEMKSVEVGSGEGVVRTGYVCGPAGGRTGELLVGQGLHLSLLCRNMTADLAE